MSLWTALRNFFIAPPAPPPSALRNKPGGLARVKLSARCDGSEEMQGCFVTTVRLDASWPGFWVIDPPLEFTLTTLALTSDGHLGGPGSKVIAKAMHDNVLEPIRDIGDGERDEALDWLPTVPRGTVLQKELL